MRMHTVLVGAGCLVIGLLASAFTPRLTAQTTPEPCQAPWEITIGNMPTRAGWHAVKWNRCTGETFVFSAEGERSEHVDDSTAWTKHPVQ